MGSQRWSIEIGSSVSAVRLFRAAILDWHTLGPKVLPQVVASGEVLQGEGEVGSVRLITFSPAIPLGFMKERIDYIDMEKLEIKQSVIEGCTIGVTLESLDSHTKFEPTSNGGCVYKVTYTYKLLDGVEADEGATQVAKASVIQFIKAAEDYLLANPNSYV